MKNITRHFITATVFLVSLASSGHAMDLQVGEIQEITGVISEREWTKSHESYCQGGSEYYVLEAEKDYYVLNSTRDPVNRKDNKEPFLKMQERLKESVGKRVIVRGRLVTLTLSDDEHCPPGSQCISGDITCSWIRTLDLKGNSRNEK